MERQEKVVLTLDSYEHGIMIRALNELRNDMLEEQRDPGPVEDVLLKTIDAHPKRQESEDVGMKPDNKTGGLWLYALGLFPVIWLALLIAPSLSGGLSEILEALPAAMNHPFQIVWCEDSGKAVLIFMAAYGLGIWDLPLIPAHLPQGRGTRFRQMGRSAGREQEIPG